MDCGEIAEAVMFKLIVMILTIIVLSSCGLIDDHTPPTESVATDPESNTNTADATDTTSLPSNGSKYELLCLQFAEISNSFDFKSPMSGYETRELFLSLDAVLNDMLLERESIMDKELVKFQNPESGFVVMFSEPIERESCFYRFVLLTNEYREKIMAGGSFLSVQYWSEDDIGYYPLATSITNSGDFTDFLDYRFIQDANIISVIQLRYSDIFLYEHNYNLLLFKFDGKDINNCEPGITKDGNGKWNVFSSNYRFYDRGGDVMGLCVRENTEEDNAYKVEIEINDKELIFSNTDISKSRITLELSDYAWKIKE